MFTANHAKAAAELERVCKSGGRIGLANWTPDGFVGRVLGIVGNRGGEAMIVPSNYLEVVVCVEQAAARSTPAAKPGRNAVRLDVSFSDEPRRARRWQPRNHVSREAGRTTSAC